MRSSFALPAISSGNAMFSTTVRQGNVDSSWNTMPIAGCGPETVWPSTITRPSSASVRPPMMLNTVDLPHPDGPITDSTSPCATSNET